MSFIKQTFLLFLLVILFSCHKSNTSAFNDKSLGVLVIYFDPGIDHQRALQVLDAAKNINAQWLRIGMIWAIANPGKDTFDFQEYDWLYTQAYNYGFKLLPVVIFTPKWISSKSSAQDYYLYPPTSAQIGDYSAGLGTYGTGYDYLYKFAKTLAQRYKDIIQYWEFWNEPDMLQSLKNPDTTDTTTSDNYARMLAYFYTGIKAGNPQAQVVLGGLADFPAQPGCVPGFAQAILSDKLYPAGNYFDIYNIHCNFRTPNQIIDQINENQKILNSFNIGQKPIWITETSYTSDINFQNLPEYQGGQDALAKYVHDVLYTELNQNVQKVFWAALFDYSPQTSDSFAYKYSGLYTYGLTLKPAGEEYKKLASLIKN